MRIIVGFIAGMLAVLAFHQPIILLLSKIGLLPATAVVYNMAALPNAPAALADALKGYGLADREKKTSVTTESIFNWASNSKPLAAVAAMQLVEKKQLDLQQRAENLVSILLSPKGNYSPINFEPLDTLYTHLEDDSSYQNIV